MAAALREQAEREVAELKAAVALQAEARRRSAVQLAEKSVRQAAMGRLRETFGATREMRAAGKVQRCWLARCARRAEQEANEAAQAAEQLADRLARARGTELRQRHYARLIAGAMREHIGRRLAVVHGAPAARPPPARPRFPRSPRAPWFVRRIARLALQAGVAPVRAARAAVAQALLLRRARRAPLRLDQGAARHERRERRAGLPAAAAPLVRPVRR